MRLRLSSTAFPFSIAVICATSLFSASATGQFPGGIDAPPAEATDSVESEAKPDELVRQLESTARRGGTYRAEAIRSLARLGAWSQVDRWVQETADTDDQAKLAETVRVIGPDVLLRISLQSEISDASRAAIKTLFAAAKSTNQSADRLRRAIDQLASEDVDTNLAANRVLNGGGNPAIAELVSAVAKGLPKRQRTKALAALKSMGDGGVQALNQIALYGDAGVRASALDALRTLDRDEALDALIAAAFATESTPNERQWARQELAIPDDFEKLDAIATLADRLETLRSRALRTPNDSSPATLWSIDESRTGVQPSRSTEVFLRYREAYDAAQRLRKLGALPPSVQRSVLAADLAYRLMVDIDWGDPKQIEQIRAAYPDQLSVQSLLTGLDEQRRREDIPATVGLIRLLASSVESGALEEPVLVGRNGKLSGLVDAVRDPQPRIRYEAASAIETLVTGLPDRPSFPGTSYVRKTLAEMASLQSRPTAILLETRPIVSLRQESILGELGYEVRTVTSARQLEHEIAKGGDLRMVVSKIRIADASPAELVDRVRRQPKGSRIPIAFFSDSESAEKSIRNVEYETTSNRWISDDTPAVYLVPLPGSPAAFADLLSEMEGKRRLPTLSVGDRSHYRSIGTKALQGESQPR
jgi:CheY-like chemotaxis protein